jgi:hypothetical protein
LHCDLEKGEEAGIQCSATHETHKFGEQIMSKYVCAAVRESDEVYGLFKFLLARPWQFN